MTAPATRPAAGRATGPMAGPGPAPDGHGHSHALGAVAASLADGRQITAVEVERFLAAKPGRPAPAPDTAIGRQLRRWALQVIAGELLAAALPGAPDAAAHEAALPSPSRLRCEIGSIAAAVLIRSPAARRALAALPDDEDPPAGPPSGGDPPAAPPVRGPGPFAELRRRQRFALELQRLAERSVTLGDGWHHPGDPGYQESLHSH